MTILFISYWGINDGLTQATVLPNVKLLASFSSIDKVILCTIERKAFEPISPVDKVVHIPLRSKNYQNVLLNKLNDFIFFPKRIIFIVNQHKVKMIICRSSLAGGIGYRVFKKTQIPYVVESLEPHAAYMIESGVWKKYDPRYWIEIFFHRVICNSAQYLLPVAVNFGEYLKGQGVNQEKIMVVPCVVDLQKFFRKNSVNHRLKLGITDHQKVGIYVGKFGGIYYDDEAFMVFAMAKEVFDQFCLIILTPDDQAEIEMKLATAGFSVKEYRLMKIDYNDVPDYLSIADFAFAMYKHSFSKKYLSPIKVGEYWACGLPVLLTEGVGDDAAIIGRSQCGATFSLDKENTIQALKKIQDQLHDEDVRVKNIGLAAKYRNPEILRNAYMRIIQSIQAI